MDEEQKNVETSNNSTNPNNTPNERKGFNVTALILGFISVVTGIFYWYASLPSGILAIIFGVAGKRDDEKVLGTAGIILGVLGLVICLVKAIIPFI